MSWYFLQNIRGQNGKLQQANSELMKRMERMSLRVTELENQSDQHVRVHDKMKDRLKSLDEQAQHQAVQLVEAITKYSQLSRDRQLLAREVEFLRSQLHKASQTSTEVLRLNSSSKVLVDDILNTMTKDERDGTIALIPELQLNIPDLPAKIDLEDTFSETGM
uniref:Uncharacterized protein n=1 Tax=Biomphalaria glabrata TaxID=6526 RepID=A0A2C9LB89_BIOGL